MRSLASDCVENSPIQISPGSTAVTIIPFVPVPGSEYIYRVILVNLSRRELRDILWDVLEYSLICLL